MTTKKIVLIVATVVVALALVVALFVGGFLGFYLYAVGKSESTEQAKDFLRHNEKLKKDIGEVKDFGTIVTGYAFPQKESSEATLNLKVIGQRSTVNASVSLVYTKGGSWHVSSASYINAAGQKILLLDPYDSRIPVPLLIA